MASKKIDYKKLDKRWQNRWKKAKLFEADIEPKRKKFFLTIPYPYVNGAPHIGAGFTFIRGDVYARFKRMQGFNVLFPQGFHATGEPIVGAVKRLKQGDKSQEEAFKIYGVSDKDLADFVKKGPKYVAKFWMKRWMKDLQSAGFSIDWRRTFITTTMTPTYSRFIEWQYNTLKKKGYVVQGTHPVVWCPNCKSPTGDHDRLEGVGESPIEYVVIKFKLDSGEILPCGTLRPETVYGVTNIWINPNAEYVRAKVDGEKWILSKRGLAKIKDQLKKVRILGKIKGSELVGKECENPVEGVPKKRIPVLPAELCDPEAATGIVMSVPSHAPYDWIGLEDLKKEGDAVAKEIEPISIIKVEGFGEHPAKGMCEKLGVKNQKNKTKLDKATELLYKKEFHTGVCKENCGPYAGMKVAELKDKLIQDFIDSGIADNIWETTANIVCRCTTKCHIKILENQWFLKFSDPEWKNRVKDNISKMKFYPKEARQQFENTVDWLKDKACTRRSGLGTPLPWDKSWIVETLSDSVIYMAYYTLARIINEKKIDAKKLTDGVFDYIFFGEGDIDKISKSIGLDKKIIEELRNEFGYFYPVDLRTSGKDLVQNHLTFYLFHHTALFDPKYWPRAIGVNGYVNVGGEKMSKSKGNFIPLGNLVEKYGADLTRINIAASNENMDDADWRDEFVRTYELRIRYLLGLVAGLKRARGRTMKGPDIYMQSVLQQVINEATKSYEEMKFRSAIQSALFGLTSELRWYIDLSGGVKNCNKKILEDAVETAIKLIAPMTPHVAEEIWNKIGNRSFVSIEAWPVADADKIDKKAIEMQGIYKKLISDIRQVMKLSGKSNKTHIYFATDKEFDYFKDYAGHLKKLGFKKVSLFLASDSKKYDPQGKANKAKYGKPGIYLE